MNRPSRSVWPDRRRLLGCCLAFAALLVAGCGEDRPPPTIATTAADPLEAALELGLDIYAAQCLTCHDVGDENELAPSLRGDLLDTFSSCAEQNEFVAIGADGWPRDVYGDDNSGFGAYDLLMNGFGNVLTPDEIAAVNLWIRVELTGLDASTAALDCGVVP